MIHAALCALLLCTAVAARTPLDGALKAAREQGVPWVLVEAPGSATQGDESLLRLQDEGQVMRAPLPPEAKELWQNLGWGGQDHWLLVSAQAEEAGDGPGLATGERVLARLRTKGLVPRWETRSAFLRKHPGSGEAWREEISMAFRLARTRMDRLLAAG